MFIDTEPIRYGPPGDGVSPPVRGDLHGLQHGAVHADDRPEVRVARRIAWHESAPIHDSAVRDPRRDDHQGVGTIAVAGLLDSCERDKLALILHGVQRSGHVPILVDAELFTTGSCRVEPTALALDRVHAVVADISGSHRALDGTPEQLTATGVTVLTADPGTREISDPARSRPASGTARSRPGARRLAGRLNVDALWPEAIDIGRRREFEGLYRQIAASGVPTLTGSWESVLNTMFKHRTRRVLEGVAPQPRYVIVTAGMTDDEIEDARHTLGPVDVWVKAPDDTHSHGVTWLATDQRIAPVARAAMRPTPDGELCLVEEDVRGTDGGGRRADLAVTVLDGRAIHATLRVQAAEGAPTNSLHGGRSFAVTPGSLPGETRDMAVAAVSAVGCRYASVDIFGGPSPVVGEVNAMPGGRSPGFLTRVTGPLVAAYVAEAARAGAGSDLVGGGGGLGDVPVFDDQVVREAPDVDHRFAKAALGRGQQEVRDHELVVRDHPPQVEGRRGDRAVDGGVDEAVLVARGGRVVVDEVVADDLTQHIHVTGGESAERVQENVLDGHAPHDVIETAAASITSPVTMCP